MVCGAVTLPALAPEWGVEDVARWLDGEGLARHRRAFESNGVDGETLVFHVTAQDLRDELHIAHLLDRKKVWNAIQRLRQETLRRNPDDPPRPDWVPDPTAELDAGWVGPGSPPLHSQVSSAHRVRPSSAPPSRRGRAPAPAPGGSGRDLGKDEPHSTPNGGRGTPSDLGAASHGPVSPIGFLPDGGGIGSAARAQAWADAGEVIVNAGAAAPLRPQTRSDVFAGGGAPRPAVGQRPAPRRSATPAAATRQRSGGRGR